MISQTQIVVSAKVDLRGDLAVLASDLDSRVLGRDNDALGLVGASGLNGLDFGPEDLVELGLGLGGGHCSGGVADGRGGRDNDAASDVQAGGRDDAAKHI